jgi:molybdate transport system substrate-binding protein
MGFIRHIAAAFLFSAAPLAAQTAVPATPADPSQGRPALPVAPEAVTPSKVINTAPAAPPAPAAQVAISIIAESSLKPVLQELAQTWADNQDGGPQVPLVLTNTATIRTRAEAGGYDVIISADVDDMKAMTTKGVLLPDNQRSLARNSLVLYGRKALVKDDELEWFDLVGGEWKKVGLGSPDLVASGRVAKRALLKHKLMNDDNKDVFVYGQTDALTLSLAQSEKVDAVFAYRTDAARMKVPGFEIMPIQAEDAPPIFYTAAVSHTSKNAELSRAFIDFCTSEAGRAIWTKYGFETN